MTLARRPIEHVFEKTDEEVPVFPTPQKALSSLMMSFVKLYKGDREKTRYPYVGRSRAEDGTNWSWVAVDAEASHEAFVAMQAAIADALACQEQGSDSTMPILAALRCIKGHLDDAVKDPPMDFHQLLSSGGTQGDAAMPTTDVSRWFAMFQVGSLRFVPELISTATLACEKILARPGRPRDEVDEKLIAEL
jgi:hypothetical protein